MKKHLGHQTITSHPDVTSKNVTEGCDVIQCHACETTIFYNPFVDKLYHCNLCDYQICEKCSKNCGCVEKRHIENSESIFYKSYNIIRRIVGVIAGK
jgi:hypothetical protein